MRNIININSGWILSAEKDRNGKKIYKNILPLNKEDEYRYYLELVGTAPGTDIFINQESVGTHQGTYTVFRVDITDKIVNGDNELDLACESDFPCRDANLMIVGKYHFSLDHYGDLGLTVVPQEISSSAATIKIMAHTKEFPSDAMISYAVLTDTGTMLTNKSVPATAPEYLCHLVNPCLWNGSSSPKLYVVVAGLIINGVTEDQIVAPFGLRTLSLEESDAVAVNGIRVPKSNLIFTLESDPFAYDDTDESGVFVCVDLTDLCTSCANEDDFQKQLTEYVMQNAYHPSIVCWKLPKEYIGFASLIHDIDPTRPVLS